MTIVYLDSSALVKLLVEEDGTDLAATLWDGCDAAVSSRLAYAEVRAALAAAARARRLTQIDLGRAEAAWEDYWAATRTVELTEAVGLHAGQLAGAHALPAADAVHLASLSAVGVDAAVFAAWDRHLRDGARVLGVQLAPSA